MKKFLLLVLCVGLVGSNICFAETIVLKTGRRIIGKVIERNDKKIIIDIFGTPITYPLEVIESIGEEVLDSSLTTEETKKHEIIITSPIRYHTATDLKRYLEECADYLDERARAVSKNLDNQDLAILIQSNDGLFKAMERVLAMVDTINALSENWQSQLDRNALLSLLRYVSETQDLLDSALISTDQAIATSSDGFVMQYLKKNKLYGSQYKEVLTKIENDLKANIEILNSR